MSFFPDAKHFTISGGSFTNINHYNVQVDPQDNLNELERSISEGLKTLSQTAVSSASHDAEQRFPHPKCHPGTRAHVLNTLGGWIRNKSKPTSVYWLYGAAGTGKSAIAQTISESLSTSSGLAASFFFSRTDPSGLRSTLSHFFITLAYQLAISPSSSPILNKPITRVVYSRPDIMQASLETQFQELIVRPCSQLSPEQLNILPRLIVIDGWMNAAEVQPPLPFEFLICSRPEPRIRNAFRHKQFHIILDCTEISDSFQSGVDIAEYLKHEFNMIRQSHGSTMAHVAQDWPGNHIIQQLVQRACGQFIYASTILKYVGDYCALPTEQLTIILNVAVPEHFGSPYPDLDLLYMLILQSAIAEQNYHLTKSILSYIVLDAKVSYNVFPYTGSHTLPSPASKTIQCWKNPKSPASLEILFSLDKGKVGALLFGLHSVLDISYDDDREVRMLHASFGDFLADPKRSGRYFIDVSSGTIAEHKAFHIVRCLSITVAYILSGHFLYLTLTKFLWHNAVKQTDWYGHCMKKVKLPSKRLLDALEQIDVQGLVSYTWKLNPIENKANALALAT
ncbi:hypothetical protein BDP27DRAFT_1321438, partial [Rhodocollybia butyracea]